MELIHIYYMVFAFLSWIGCLVFDELRRDDDFKYMYEFDDDFFLVLLTHALIIVISLMLPWFWPLILFYYVIRIIVKSIAKLIKMQGNERKEKGD